MSDNIPVIDGIDSKTAINSSGCTTEDYLDILKTYYRSIDSKANDIENAFNNNDIENYTIYVHALKSSSRAIGAYELGDMAYELELCGKSGDIDTIRANTPYLLSTLEILSEKMAPFFQTNNDICNIDEEELISMLEELKIYLADSNLVLVNDTLTQLESVYYNEDSNELINTLSDLALQMEYEHCIDLINEYLCTL